MSETTKKRQVRFHMQCLITIDTDEESPRQAVNDAWRIYNDWLGRPPHGVVTLDASNVFRPQPNLELTTITEICLGASPPLAEENFDA